MTPPAQTPQIATGIDLRFDPDRQLHVLTLNNADPDGDDLEIMLAMNSMDLLNRLDELQGEITVLPDELDRIRARLFDEILADAATNATLVNESGAPADPTQITRLQFGVDSWDNGYFPASSTLRMFYDTTGAREITVELDDELEYPLSSIDDHNNHRAFAEAQGSTPVYSGWQLVLYRDGLEHRRR